MYLLNLAFLELELIIVILNCYNLCLMHPKLQKYFVEIWPFFCHLCPIVDVGT